MPSEIKYPPESFFINRLTAKDFDELIKGNNNSILMNETGFQIFWNKNSNDNGPIIKPKIVTNVNAINNNLIESLILI